MRLFAGMKPVWYAFQAVAGGLRAIEISAAEKNKNK